jgi:hypothetical protein
MKLTVRYKSEDPLKEVVKIYYGSEETIDALIRELRNDKSKYISYIREKSGNNN